jgi:hypothetical protein
MCACTHINIYFRTYVKEKESVQKRRSFMNMLSRNIVTFEMSDVVGKMFRAICFELFFSLLFSEYAPTFSTNPDSVCVFARRLYHTNALNTE